MYVHSFPSPLEQSSRWKREAREDEKRGGLKRWKTRRFSAPLNIETGRKNGKRFASAQPMAVRYPPVFPRVIPGKNMAGTMEEEEEEEVGLMEDYAGSFLLFSPTTGLYTATISRAFHLATRFSFVYRRAGMERFSRHGLEKGRTRRTQFVLIRECENLLLHSLYYILFQRLSSRNHFARELLRNDIRLHVLISLS